MTHKETAYAQLVLTVVFLVGYFWVLTDFVHGRIHTPPEWKDTLQALLSILTANVGVIVVYWFSRQRVSTDPGQS